MNQKLTSLLKSRRFWAAVAGVAAVIAAEAWGVELDQNQLTNITLVVVGWILGDSIKPTE